MSTTTQSLDSIPSSCLHAVSETQVIIPYPWQFAGRNVVLVDTPGFDDTYKSDGDILQSLVEWLARTYQNGTKLSGIIYLHRITDVRMQGSAMRNLRVFRELCGPGFFPHVTLCAAFWSTSPYKQKEQNQRIHELTGEGGYWSSMVAAGSTVFREQLTRQAAIQMIFKLLRNGERTMQIQREVVDEHRAIQESSAVATLMSIQLERQEQEHQEKMAELKQHLEDTVSARDRTHSENLESMRLAFETRLKEAESMNARFRSEINDLHNATQHQPLTRQPPLLRKPVATTTQFTSPFLVDFVSTDVPTDWPLRDVSGEDLDSLRRRQWLEQLAKELNNRSPAQPVVNQAHPNVSSMQATTVPKDTPVSSSRPVAPRASIPRRQVSSTQLATPNIPSTPTEPQAQQRLGVLVISTVLGEIHLRIQTIAHPDAKMYTRMDRGVRNSRDRRSVIAGMTVNTAVSNSPCCMRKLFLCVRASQMLTQLYLSRPGLILPSAWHREDTTKPKFIIKSMRTPRRM